MNWSEWLHLEGTEAFLRKVDEEIEHRRGALLVNPASKPDTYALEMSYHSGAISALQNMIANIRELAGNGR
jgi:hypothetical protein